MEYHLMVNHTEIKWLTESEDKKYPAAASYLSLIYDDATANALVNKLKKTTITQFKAKDIFRASGLSLLGISNTHVEKDRKKVKDGIEISPILLVRDQNNGKVVIADGYHRMCAVYSF
jgi:hypothetical protein